MSKENQDCFFHQKEFFVERKLNEKGEFVLVSQKKPVDFDQFTDVINLDKCPKFGKPKELVESGDHVETIPVWEKKKRKKKSNNKNPKSKGTYIAKGPFID